MPNSEVKRNSADGSVGLPHVRVGHRQALISTCLDETSQHRILSHHKNLEFYVDLQSQSRIIRIRFNAKALIAKLFNNLNLSICVGTR